MTKLHALDINVDLSHNFISKATKNVTLNFLMHDFALHFCKGLINQLLHLYTQYSRNENFDKAYSYDTQTLKDVSANSKFRMDAK